MMKKINSKIACGFLAVSLAAASFAGCGKEAPLDGTKIAATVDGQDVTLGMASFMLRDQQAQMENFYHMMSQSYGMEMPDTIWEEKKEDGKTTGEVAKEDVMNHIKTLIAIKEHAEEYQVTLTEEEQDKIKETAKAFMDANEEETLKKLAVSQKDMETYLELVTYQQKMREPMLTDVDREVSDEEAGQSKVTYVRVSTTGKQDAEGAVIEMTEEEKAEQKEKAEKVLAEMKKANVAEVDMDGVAKQVDETIGAYPMNYTTAGSEEDTLDPAVIEAVASLKDGELAQEVIEGADGYYVVRMDMIHDQEATERKKTSIISERENKAYEKMTQEWADATKTKIHKENWEKVTLTDNISFQYQMPETEPQQQ